jgi:hypothetical protein
MPLMLASVLMLLKAAASQVALLSAQIVSQLTFVVAEVNHFVIDGLPGYSVVSKVTVMVSVPASERFAKAMDRTELVAGRKCVVQSRLVG